MEKSFLHIMKENGHTALENFEEKSLQHIVLYFHRNANENRPTKMVVYVSNSYEMTQLNKTNHNFFISIRTQKEIFT